MKNILMSSQMGLTSVRRNTALPCGGQIILADGAAAPALQANSAFFQAETGRWFAPTALPATDVPAVRNRVGGSYAATTKHIGNGGLRGPQPWGHPPVIT
ncbi:hypothetical protein OG339_03930 [Streptosporangium sp. NBC_01495]|uniref:hypothetical protein n=1 Tax=Streptosporangium sp. NBC_01495 TaxID=2903899 RepID=UPI002E2FA0D5|nr:hypothetical protein [Streptosporangium sp. NBC_01495]